MGLFRDSRDRRDLSLKVRWTLAVWLMPEVEIHNSDDTKRRGGVAASGMLPVWRGQCTEKLGASLCTSLLVKLS